MQRHGWSTARVGNEAPGRDRIPVRPVARVLPRVLPRGWACLLACVAAWVLMMAQAMPVAAQPDQTQPVQTQPDQTQPVQTQPDQTQQVQPQPDQIQAEPVQPVPVRGARPGPTGLVFVAQQYPPFNYMERTDTGEQLAGPMPEIIGMACRRMGVGCAFRLLPWARAQQEVRNGAADGIFTIGHVPERETWLHFCPPLVRAEYGFFVRMENPLRYVTPRDVAGYRVGVYGPSLTADILNQLARQVPMTVDAAPDNDSGFLKLAQGRIDAVFSNRENGLAIIAQLRIANLRYAGWHNRLDYTIAFSRHAAPEAVAAFEAALRDLHREGELQRCLARYGLQSAYPEADGDRRRGRPQGGMPPAFVSMADFAGGPAPGMPTD